MTITKHQQKKYFRRALLGLLVLFTAMAQNVPWLPVVYGARAFPLIPLVIAIAFYDQPIPAILYAALAGIIWDVSSPTGAYHGIFLVVAAFAVAMLMRYFLNRNIFTIAMLSFVATTIYLLVRWFITFAILPNLSPAQLTLPLLRESLPALGYTMLTVPLVFTLVSLIVRRTSRKQLSVRE